MNWIPKNKKTGKEYPQVDDAGKKELENYQMTAGKYTFIPVGGPAPKTTNVDTTLPTGKKVEKPQE